MSTARTTARLGLLTLLVAAPLRAALLHVAVDGNDAWSGALPAANPSRTDGPFATLARGQQAVRGLIAAGLNEPVELCVHAGTYHLAEPLRFTPNDSGTQACPVTYRAVGRAIISGGQTIDGWQRADGGLWSAVLPEPLRGKKKFRCLRVGDRWGRRARYPDPGPNDPLKSGWLFADWHGEPWELGLLNRGVSDIHTPGEKLIWHIRVSRRGSYHVWLRYGSSIKDSSVPDMGGRTTVRVDDAAAVPLENLPDTGGWSKYVWSRCALLDVASGERTLTWENVQGGGLALDAIALTQNHAWDPNTAISAPTWWGAFEIQKPAAPNDLIFIQAEACEPPAGKSVKVHAGTPPGITQYLRYHPGDLPDWGEVKGAEVAVFPAWGWVSGIVPVESIDPAARQIAFTVPGASQDIRMGNRYFIENVRAALDRPGEWFLDAASGRVDMIPPEGTAPPFETIAPRLDRLVEMSGEGDRWVEHIALIGFTFTDADWTLTHEYYTPKDAAIHMARARRCAVRDCEFRWLGGYGARLEAASHEIEFAGNDLHDLGQGGIILLGDHNDNQPHHNRVIGNTMSRLGLIYKHVGAVYCTTASDNLIAHNTITDVSRYGISLKSYSPQACSLRNTVEYNEIRRSNLETNDTGAIETLGRSQQNTGNVIRHNLILDVVGIGTERGGKIVSPYFNWGIYLDDYSSGITVFGNIVARTANGGICVHGGKDNTFENNIFLNAVNEQIRLQPRDEFMKGNRFLRNIVAFSGTDSPLIYSWERGSNTFAEWDHNLYWQGDGDLKQAGRKLMPTGDFASWQAAGHDTHSIVADPHFIDPARDDYRLREDSPAPGLGFKEIPVDQIGAAWWRARNPSR